MRSLHTPCDVTMPKVAAQTVDMFYPGSQAWFFPADKRRRVMGTVQLEISWFALDGYGLTVMDFLHGSHIAPLTYSVMQRGVVESHRAAFALTPRSHSPGSALQHGSRLAARYRFGIHHQ